MPNGPPPVGQVSDALSSLGRLLLAAIGVLLFAIMFAGDYLTGLEFESSIFYVVPVSFFGWFVGRRAGLVAAGASGVVTLAVHAAYPPLRHPTVVFWNAAAWLCVYAFLAILLAEVRAAFERERGFSRTDVLTGIANRRAFFEVLEVEVSRAIRYGHPLTLAYLDVDHFKQVNDRLGHAAGDEVLATVAQTMRHNLRKPDVVARLGGDEFAVVLPDIDGESAVAALRNVHDALNGALSVRQWGVTFSVGAVTFERPPESVREVIRAADAAMYASKANGRDQLLVRTRAA